MSVLLLCCILTPICASSPLHRNVGEGNTEIVYHRKLSKDKRRKSVVDVVKVTDALYGYDGWLGICIGHPTLIHDAKPLRPAGKKEEEKESSDGSDSTSDFLDALEERAKEDPDGKMTNKEILALLQQKMKTKPSVVTVSTGGSISSVSNGTPLVSDQMLVLPNATLLLTYYASTIQQQNQASLSPGVENKGTAGNLPKVSAKCWFI